jgi:cytochrome P450
MIRPAHVPVELVIDFDAFEPTTIESMLAKVETWRERGPVLWTDRNHGHWVVLGATQARTVLTDQELFSSAVPNKGVTGLLPVQRARQVPVEMDGAEHRSYRRLLIPLFSPRRMRLLDEEIRSLARELIAGFIDRGRCDVVADYARPMVSGMFLRLMDWPDGDRIRLERLTSQEIDGVDGTPDERAAAKQRANLEMNDYVQSRIAERRGSADASDVTAVLMRSVIDDEPIIEANLLGLLRLLMIGGLDTTQSVLSQTMTHLAARPRLQEAIRVEPRAVPGMVEEFLRVHPAALVSRTAVRDVELGGAPIRPGDVVLPLFPAANRDPDEFPRPAHLDFDRANCRQHVTFGAGAHMCIGAPLARTVLVAALDEFHRAVGAYRLTDAESHIGLVWGMNRVELALEPARVAV